MSPLGQCKPNNKRKLVGFQFLCHGYDFTGSDQEQAATIAGWLMNGAPRTSATKKAVDQKFNVAELVFERAKRSYRSMRPSQQRFRVGIKTQ